MKTYNCFLAVPCCHKEKKALSNKQSKAGLGNSELQVICRQEQAVSQNSMPDKKDHLEEQIYNANRIDKEEPRSFLTVDICLQRTCSEFIPLGNNLVQYECYIEYIKAKTILWQEERC